MRTICFVTTELYPATHGGIGKLLFDTISDLDKSDLFKVTVLFVSSEDKYIELNSFACSQFKNTKVYHLDRLLCDIPSSEDIPLWGFHFEEYYLSYRIALALKKIIRVESVETIEFCDYLGLGYVSIKWKKLLGDVFEGVNMLVKVHGSKELCDNADGENIFSKRQLVAYHLERYALTNCDSLIVPSKAIARYYREFYQLKDLQYQVVTPTFQKMGNGLSHSRELRKPFQVMFYGKIQKLKGVETFVSAAVDLLRKCKEEVVFDIYGHSVSYGWCASYEEQVLKLIPSDLKKYFNFKGRINISELETISKDYSFAVVPSTFETFCLAAHELNWIGIPLIVNDIPGFEDYFSSDSCFKFDGSSKDLSSIMTKIINDRSAFKDLGWNADKIARQASNGLNAYLNINLSSSKATELGDELVSVIIPYFNMQNYVDAAVLSVLDQSYSNIEIIVVNDGSTSPHAISKLAELKATYPEITILNKENGGLGSARNFGVKTASGNYIVSLDSDDILHKDYIMNCVKALRHNKSLMAVSCYVNFFMDGETPEEHIDYVIPYDLVPDLIFVENRAGVATSVFRKEVFNTIQYNEDLTSYEDWDFWWQCVNNNFQAEVIPIILFHYRRRIDSMINTEGLSKHVYHLHKMVNYSGDWLLKYSTNTLKQLITSNNELWIRNINLQKDAELFKQEMNAIGGVTNYQHDARNEISIVQEWYDKEYEVLPLWYKRIGHLIKVAKGKRTLKSLLAKQ